MDVLTKISDLLYKVVSHAICQSPRQSLGANIITPGTGGARDLQIISVNQDWRDKLSHPDLVSLVLAGLYDGPHLQVCTVYSCDIYIYIYLAV